MMFSFRPDTINPQQQVEESFPSLSYPPPRQQPAVIDSAEMKQQTVTNDDFWGVATIAWETTDAVEKEPEEAKEKVEAFPTEEHEPEFISQPTPPTEPMPPVEVDTHPKQFLTPSPLHFNGGGMGSMLGFSPTLKSACPINELAIRFAMEVTTDEMEYQRQLAMAHQVRLQLMLHHIHSTSSLPFQKIGMLEALRARSLCVGCQAAMVGHSDHSLSNTHLRRSHYFSARSSSTAPTSPTAPTVPSTPPCAFSASGM